ncbi:MAG: DUF6952 family protein [Nannocystaceae bacterium]
MKAGVIRKLAEAHTQEALDAAADALAEGEAISVEVAGDDDGERLTHLMLASRIRTKVDAGTPLKEAFREVMADVRGVISNG